MSLKAARRYANAFLQIALEKQMVEKILEDVRSIEGTIESSRELFLFLRSPIIKSDDKQAVLKEIFSPAVEPLTMQFLEFVARKGRERLIPQIMQGFIDLYKKQAGIIDVEVRAAMELEQDQRKKLEQALEEVTRKQVDLSYVTDPGLIGGVAIRIDDTVIDGTLKHKIDQLGTLFQEAAI